MKSTRILFWASLGLLMLLVAGMLLGSFNSVMVAYRGAPDHLAGVGFDEIRALPGGGDNAVKAIRARRATAATWAMAYAILMALVVLGPYRQGKRWAWWALLVSLGLPNLISLARVPLIGTTSGALPSAIGLAILLLGLLAGAPKMFAHKIEGLD
ncbi:MAG: hypothetical protein ACREDR_12505 [Blastocatellia bacterium]